ncbi:MAG: sugar ABC transporter substrate-binding protein [Acinetobacter sp.]
MKQFMALVLAMVLVLSCSTAAQGEISIAEETDKVISMRLEKGADEVLSFYDSWSAAEFAQGKKPGEGFKVAVGTGDLVNDTALFGFWTTVRTLQSLGCEVIYNIGDGSYSPNNAQVMENFVAQSPNAIMWQFGNSQILAAGLEKAAQRNIPVFGIDNNLTGDTVVSEVTADNFEIGRIAARYVINNLGGKGNVVDIFSPGHRGIETRNKMWELISGEFEDVKEVSRIPWDLAAVQTSVRDRMEATLQANPTGSIQAVFACYDIPAMAAADAIKAAGRDKEMFVIGIDGDREALINVAKGGCLKATISQDFTLMGMSIAFEIVDHLNGKMIPRFLYAPVTLVTEANVADVYMQKYGEALPQ